MSIGCSFQAFTKASTTKIVGCKSSTNMICASEVYISRLRSREILDAIHNGVKGANMSIPAEIPQI